MLLNLLALLAPLLVFGLVIFVHELGHYLAAKAVNVYVPRFSIGFGPALWRKRWGETEYIVAALPLGGYVRMASREDEAMALLEGGGETSPPNTVGGSGVGKLANEEVVSGPPDRADWDPEALVPFGPKPVPEHRWFESKPLWARLVILLAGVTMNVLLAVIAASGLAWTYGRLVYDTTTIGWVDTTVAPAALREQVQIGDTILAIGAQPVATWNDVIERAEDLAGDNVVFTTQRGRVEVDLPDRALLATFEPMRRGLFEPLLPPLIDTVLPGSAAARAGLQPGDSVIAIAGEPLLSWQQLVRRVSTGPAAPIDITVLRDGQPVTLRVTPDSVETQDPATGETGYRRQIGIQSVAVGRTVPLGPGEAIAQGWDATWRMAGTIVDVLRGLGTGDVSPSALGGPIEIARQSVAAARAGIGQLAFLIALISINVAVLNLLPIPVLDGGQIVLNLAEAAKGSAFSTRTREYILRFGLAVILLLVILVMWNDIARIVRSFG